MEEARRAHDGERSDSDDNDNGDDDEGEEDNEVGSKGSDEIEPRIHTLLLAMPMPARALARTLKTLNYIHNGWYYIRVWERSTAYN